MDILVVNLRNSEITKREALSCSGLEAGLSLYKEYGEDAFVLAGASPDNSGKGGRASWCMVYYSPYLGHREFVSLSLPQGYSMLRMGIQAIVLLDRSDKLKFLSVYPDNVELIPCEHLRTASSATFAEVACRTASDLSFSTGPAADKGVLFGTLQTSGRNLPGLGAGSAFYSHNLKGLVMPGFSQQNKDMESRKKLTDSFIRETRAYGGYTFLTSALRLGWAPVSSWQDRFDPRACSLDGKAMAERYGNYPESCGDCFLSCSRRMRDSSPLPQWNDVMSLGTNLGFFDPENVQKLYEACIQEGLDCSVIGALLAYTPSLSKEQARLFGLSGKNVDEYCALIHRIGTGSVLANGLKAFPEAIQGYDGRPVSYDLRGAFSQALMLSLGLPLDLPGTLLFPKKPVQEECSAIIAFYETIGSLALMALGYASFPTEVTYWARVPEIAYHVPFIARFYAERFTVDGYRPLEFQKLGLRVLEELSPEWHGIPEHFAMDSNSAFDSATVSLRRLRSYFEVEKARLERTLKSRSEKKQRPSSEKSPAVGPSEERGSAADPGLNR